MKVWIAILAIAALILAGVSIWFGLGVSARYGLDLFISSSLVALAAVFLGIFSVPFGARYKGRAFALKIVAFLAGVVPLLGLRPGIAGYAYGPFCGQYPSDIGVARTICPPLWISILDFADIVVLALAALLYVFWPQKRLPMNAAAQTGVGR